MEITVQSQKTLRYDVAVIGGGTAGVFAAISAARTGAKTVLIERSSALGGTVTSGGVNFPGLFYAWGKQIIAGPCWEAIQRTVQLGGAELPTFLYHRKWHWEEQILVNMFIFRSVIMQMCKESGVEVLMNSMIASVQDDNDGVLLLVTAKEGIHQIRAKVAIDATGDANAVTLAGYATVKSPTQQPATPQNHLSGYVYEDVDVDQLRSRFAEADFPPQITADRILYYLEIQMFNFHVPCEDAQTSGGRSKLEFDAMELATKLYIFCRTIRGLENLTVDYYAQETGVRESVRIVGEKTLTAMDYITGRDFEDGICYAYYPIDLHVMDGIKQDFFAEETIGRIPYGALIPKGAKRLLCAGRCISSDADANSAIRVQAPCMATGQAAGCAAAIAAKENIPVAEVEYAALCRSLEEIGAIVPKGNILG